MRGRSFFEILREDFCQSAAVYWNFTGSPLEVHGPRKCRSTFFSPNFRGRAVQGLYPLPHETAQRRRGSPVSPRPAARLQQKCSGRVWHREVGCLPKRVPDAHRSHVMSPSRSCFDSPPPPPPQRPRGVRGAWGGGGGVGLLPRLCCIPISPACASNIDLSDEIFLARSRGVM